ncbi:MAG: alkaline phosphatase [Bacteroidota bacterium]
MTRRLLALAALLPVAACSAPPMAPAPAPEAPVMVAPAQEAPRNLILFIADGFGPASATMGAAAVAELGEPWALGDGLLGSVETSATDNRVTDSAAGATAYACGLKTYNGAVGVTPEQEPCRTVLEAAEARGMATGLVATSRITHATPASFAAHVVSRSQEDEIASQLVASGVEVLIGGGLRHFEGREDGRDLLAEMAATGVRVATERTEFDALDTTPAAALFAPSHLAYEVDRGATDQPSLAEMTTKAIDLLSEASGDAGFFLMVEASRIDHAAHGNDVVGHLHDILAYNRAVRAAKAWAERDGSTLIVATSDHETGGMTLARDDVYFWDPTPILQATSSMEALGNRVMAGADPIAAITEAVGRDSLDTEAEAALRELFASGDRAAAGAFVTNLVSEPAGIGWTTGGHTAIDVGLYAWGPGADAFLGRHTNDAVGRALFAALGLEP